MIFVFTIHGLIEAFEEKMPNVEHMYCIKHMYENFKLQFSKVDKQLTWSTAGATIIKTFKGCMQKLKEADPKVFDWAMGKNP